MNGISTTEDLQSYMEEMRSKDVDIWGWAETSIKWNKEMESKAQYMGRKLFKNFTLVTSCSDNPAQYYQQGGTCIRITNRLTCQIINSDCNPSMLGR
eukprot:5573137-Ditylum_brightwellii.AAC.1